MATVAEIVAAAKAGIENLRPGELAAELRGGDVLLIDVREPDEVSSAVIPGAIVVPRGMLEFRADPATPHHLEAFAPDRRVIVYCAAGSRSALAARSLQQLGYSDVAHLDGGFTAWVEDGHPVDSLSPPDRGAPAEP